MSAQDRQAAEECALNRLRMHDQAQCPDGGCQIVALMDEVARLRLRIEAAEQRQEAGDDH